MRIPRRQWSRRLIDIAERRRYGWSHCWRFHHMVVRQRFKHQEFIAAARATRSLSRT